MAKIESFKRIIKEDFDSEQHGLVEKLAFPINAAFESIGMALNKGLNFEDNFNAQIREVTLVVNASGIPTPKASFQADLRGNCRGLICIRVENLTNASEYPSGQPFVSFSQNGAQIVITHVSGLTAGRKYRLRLLAMA